MISSYLINYFSNLDLERRNCHGFTAMMKAAMQGRADVVRLLMLSGRAKIFSISTSFFTMSLFCCWTAILYLCIPSKRSGRGGKGLRAQDDLQGVGFVHMPLRDGLPDDASDGPAVRRAVL